MNKSLVLVAVLIVAGGIGYYLYSNTALPADTGNTDTSVAGMLAEDNAVVVMEQKPGASITASLVYLATPGFLVIHADANGEPGAILGASALLQAGESSQIVVTLSRATRNGEKLHAMLHTDADASGSFYASTDTPVQSRLGGPIEGWFEVSSEASGNVPVSI